MRRGINIVVIALSFALLACTNKEVTPIVPDESDMIHFGRVATKGVDGIEDIDEFGVWMAMKGLEETSDYVSSLANERVYHPDSAHENWVYDNTRYWFKDYDYYFVASYPYSSDGTKGFQILRDTYEFDFLYALSVDAYNEETKTHNGVDILTAYNSVNTSGPSEEWMKPVQLNFSHLLTKVNLKISQDTRQELGDPINNYYIKSVSISGLITDAQYLLLPQEESGKLGGAWLTGNATSPYVKTFTVDYTKPLKNREVSVWGDNGEGGLLLIPQSIPHNAVQIKIDYVYELYSEDTSATPDREDRTFEIYIPASDLLQSNSVITYKLSFSKASKITFLAPEVEQWGAPQTGGTIIIQ